MSFETGMIKLGRINIYAMMGTRETLRVCDYNFDGSTCQKAGSAKVKLPHIALNKTLDYLDGFFARFWDLRTMRTRELKYFVMNDQAWLGIDTEAYPFDQVQINILKSFYGTFKFTLSHSQTETTYTSLRTGITNMFVDGWYTDDEITSIALMINVLCHQALRERYTNQIKEKDFRWRQLIFNSEQVYASARST